MATKKTTTAGSEEPQKKNILEVSNDRMERLLNWTISLLTKKQVKTNEMMLVGRELLRLGAEQLISDNRLQPADFAATLVRDLDNRLRDAWSLDEPKKPAKRKKAIQMPIGEA